MALKYKRKFKVPGDTPRVCTDFCKNYFLADTYDELPPCIRDKARKLGRTWNLYDHFKEMHKCPHRNELGKPREYIVSEMEDGTWRCSCPVWKFRRRQCHHIDKAKANPELYEIAIEHTEKTTKVFDKLFRT